MTKPTDASASSTTSWQFAIVTDTHIRVPGGDLSSPFPVNNLANDRARYAVAMLQAANPEFTIHLGDVIHPLPHMPAAAAAAAEAQEILQPLQPNLHFVPGNHDIGDKPSDLMPAGPVDAQAVDHYEAAIGPQHYAFRHREVHVVCINSSLVNSGSQWEQQQRQWLEAELRGSDAAIKLLFSHYPPFILDADEPDHYDNYAEPGRGWLLALAKETGVTAIFSGHVHHFFYNRWHGIPLYCLPATSFTRQDYAELFPLAPEAEAEFGRNDTGKFGITVVNVCNGDVSLDVHATQGSTDLSDKIDLQPPPVNRLIPHLRHAWHLPQALPYNGPMEEFSRKQARNDYPLLRLLQLGIRTIRVPATDLLEPLARARLEDWIALDRRIVVFATGEIPVELQAACRELANGIQALEWLHRLPADDHTWAQPAEAIRLGDIPIWLSAISTSADNPDPNRTFAHAVTAGAYPQHLSKLLDGTRQFGATAVVMQIPWETTIEASMASANAALAAHHSGQSGTPMSLAINLCLRPGNPAHQNIDDTAIAQRLHQAIALLQENPGVELMLDTFEDIDRGYGPRHGLIDRLSNIRDVVAAPLLSNLSNS